MNTAKLTISSILLLIIRTVFLPIKLVYHVIYSPAPVIMGYAWYSAKDYELVVANSDDPPEDIIPSHSLWIQHAMERIEEFRRKKWVVIRIRVSYRALSKWLKEQDLLNTSENREKFVGYRLNNFMERGII